MKLNLLYGVSQQCYERNLKFQKTKYAPLFFQYHTSTRESWSLKWQCRAVGGLQHDPSRRRTYDRSCVCLVVFPFHTHIVHYIPQTSNDVYQVLWFAIDGTYRMLILAENCYKYGLIKSKPYQTMPTEKIGHSWQCECFVDRWNVCTLTLTYIVDLKCHVDLSTLLL